MRNFSAIPTNAINDPELPDSVYRTLGAITAHTDAEGWCYPSKKHLASVRGVSRQTITKHVKRLVELGYVIEQTRHRPDGGQTSNMVRVIFDTPRKPQEFTPPVNPKSLHPPSTLGVDTYNTTELTLQPNSVSPNGKRLWDFSEYPEINTDEIVELWGKWSIHKREINSPLTQTAGNAQLKKLAEMGEKRAITAIMHSIASGWKSIHEPNQKGSVSSSQMNSRGNSTSWKPIG